ncbi:MAG: hypothetical protein PHU23_18630 [Dehalococcoidales bacterium]|nr:hypothetical protein [Dehalococcoidales bacterium]
MKLKRCVVLSSEVMNENGMTVFYLPENGTPIGLSVQGIDSKKYVAISMPAETPEELAAVKKAMELSVDNAG